MSYKRAWALGCYLLKVVCIKGADLTIADYMPVYEFSVEAYTDTTREEILLAASGIYGAHAQSTPCGLINELKERYGHEIEEVIIFPCAPLKGQPITQKQGAYSFKTLSQQTAYSWLNKSEVGANLLLHDELHTVYICHGTEVRPLSRGQFIELVSALKESESGGGGVVPSRHPLFQRPNLLGGLVLVGGGVSVGVMVIRGKKRGQGVTKDK